jgi:hypothetical protein
MAVFVSLLLHPLLSSSQVVFDDVLHLCSVL